MDDDERAAFYADPAHREPVSDVPKIRKLDFSLFHPLDHELWECRLYSKQWAEQSEDGQGFYGDWRTHLRYLWEYKWRMDVKWWLGRNLTCKVLPHVPQEYRLRASTTDEWATGHTCARCFARLD